MNRLLNSSFLLALAALSALGQTTGELRGTIADQAGAAVPNAKVVVASRATGESRNLVTDAEGRFAAPLLTVGEYEIKVEKTGFRTTSARADVKTGEVASARILLEVGQVTESVTVSGAVTRLDAENAQIQGAIVGENIQEIPVQRNPNLFALTMPGVTPVTANNPFLGSGSFNSNGGRGRGNNITVDGIVSTDVSTTGTGGVLGPLNFSELGEVKVITNNFSAEYGRNSSSQVIYTTKGGTNNLHGELYEYLQNDKLNARPFFDTSGKTNVVRQNQFGFSVGGPVYIPKLLNLRNKLFWRTSYEGFKLRGAGAARSAQVPTASMIAAVTDPTSKALLDQYKLPAAQSDAGAFGRVQQNAGNGSDTYQFSVRSDYNLTDSDRLWVRYGRFVSTSRSSGNTFINTNLANFGAYSTNLPQQATLAHTHTFGAAAVNEFYFGFGQSKPNFIIESTVPLGPRIIFQDASISSFGVWEGLPQGREQRTYQFRDNASFVRGRHNFKAGFEHFILQAESFLDGSVRPVFNFANWAAFAAGTPSTYAQNFGNSLRAHRQNMQFAFFQDDWKVSRNLTLNLGVRLETVSGITEASGKLSNLNLNCTDSMGAAGTGAFGCIQIVKEAFSRNNNWAPRFGFAYDLGGKGKTVIRGGYGIAYDFNFFNPITNQRSLPPFIVNAGISGPANFTGENTFARIVAGTSKIQADTSAQQGRISTTALNFGNFSPALDSNLANPQTQQFSLGIQHDFGKFVVKAGYVGTKGNYLLRTRTINFIANPPAPATSVADETARIAEFNAANGGATGNAALRSNRVDPRFNLINYIDNSSNSNFHSAQFEVQRRLTRDFHFTAAYTIGKSIDDVSDPLGVLINDSSGQQNPRNNRDNRAVSQFDLPQRLVISHVWQVPFFKNVANPVARQVLHGWAFAGITSFRAGFPVSLESGARRGISASTLTGFTNGPVRPNAGGTFSFNPVPAGSAGSPSALNADTTQRISAYAEGLGLSQPLLGNYGTLGRNTHRLNGERNFDWNIYKDFYFSREHDVKLQFRTELYNVFNNTAFQDVNRNITGAAFGQYTTVAQNARFMQMALRLVF
jgi:hypothetical protein